MTTTTIDYTNRLYIALPLYCVEHFAKQKKCSNMHLIGNFVTKNIGWCKRLFDENTCCTISDIQHDFVGLLAEDEFFLPII